MTTLVVVPVLRRPWRVSPLLLSLQQATPATDYRLVFACTTGDDAQIEAVKDTGCEWFSIDHHRGDYARKINTAFDRSDDPHLFLAADDLNFYDGWLPNALAHMTETVGVVGTQDLGNPRVLRGEHATHSVVARWYVNQHGTATEPGKVLHEGYWHEYVDDELVGMAKKRGAWAFAHDSIVEHLHPHWGKCESDEIYDAQSLRLRQSRSLFNRRRRMWT